MSLDAVEAGPQAAPLRELVYGPEGIGKSTFGAGAPGPIFLDVDRGTKRLDVRRFPRPVEGYVWQDVLDAVAALRSNPGPYRTLVIDTLDAVEPLVARAVCDEGGKSAMEDFAYGKGWLRAVDLWRDLMAALEDLQAARGTHVILLAHAHVKKYSNPTGEDYDRYALKINEKSAAVLREWCSSVLFCNYDHRTKQDPRTKRVKGVQVDARFLFTTRNVGWEAKNRYGLPSQMPLDFAEFWSFVEAGVPSDDAVREEIEAGLAMLSSESAEKIRGALARAGRDAEKLSILLNLVRARIAQASEQSAARAERIGVAPGSHALAPDKPVPVTPAEIAGATPPFVPVEPPKAPAPVEPIVNPPPLAPAPVVAVEAPKPAPVIALPAAAPVATPTTKATGLWTVEELTLLFGPGEPGLAEEARALLAAPGSTHDRPAITADVGRLLRARLKDELDVDARDVWEEAGGETARKGRGVTFLPCSGAVFSQFMSEVRSLWAEFGRLDPKPSPSAPVAGLVTEAGQAGMPW